jgi:hypothetical protein
MQWSPSVEKEEVMDDGKRANALAFQSPKGSISAESD